MTRRSGCSRGGPGRRDVVEGGGDDAVLRVEVERGPVGAELVAVAEVGIEHEWSGCCGRGACWPR